MTDVLVYIGVTMLGVGIAVLFSIAMATIRQGRLDEQANRTGYALASTPDLSNFSEDEIAEQLEVRRVLREVAEANAFRAELARLARGPSAFSIIGALISNWLLFCGFIAATWVAVRWIVLAI
jgi:hypothetical protein